MFMEQCPGAVAWWLNMRNHNTGVASSIPPCVTFKTPLVKKAAEPTS